MKDLQDWQEVEGLVEIFPPENIRLKEILILRLREGAGAEILHPEDSGSPGELDCSEEVLVADDPSSSN